MTATEARKRANSVLTTSANEQLVKCRQAISKAVDRGKFECTIDGSFLPGVKSTLESEGYKMEVIDSFRNELYTKISW